MPPTEILIIDDDPAVRDMLSLYLRSDGHTVRTAAMGGSFDRAPTPEELAQIKPWATAA